MTNAAEPAKTPDRRPSGSGAVSPERGDAGSKDLLPAPGDERPTASASSPGNRPGGAPSQAVSHVQGIPAAGALLASKVVSAVVWTAFSFVIVYWACQTANLESTTWLVISLWILSGVVVVWSGVDALLTRILVGSRQPTMVEQRRLMPSWMAAAHKSGVYGPRYSLWIEESKGATAAGTVGYTVAVTHWALYTLPPSHLEAVLAREVMVRHGGEPWLSRLGFWYSIPARLVALALRYLIRLSRTLPAVGWTILCFLLVSYLGLILVAVVFYEDPTGPLLYLLPLVAPLVLVGLRRWNERMGDRAAADLGYGPHLIEMLYGWQSQQQTAARRSPVGQAVGTPSVAERIRALELYQQRLQATRRGNR